MKWKGDLLGEKLKGVKASELDAALTRPAPRGVMLSIRLSLEERDAIAKAAYGYGLTVTDYLLRLHRFASSLPEGKK